MCLWDRIGLPADIDDFLAIEALTNDRVREARGKIARSRIDDRITGPGSTPIMSAFAYGRTGRFNDETFGAYYAAFSEAAAIAESPHARERFLKATNEPSVDVDMRVYTARVSGQYDDVRKRSKSHAMYDASSYEAAQARGRRIHRVDKLDGVVYRSVRRWTDGECVAAFRPRCVTAVRATKHLRYTWDGTMITTAFESKIVPL